MASVVQMLSNSSLTLQTPFEPASSLRYTSTMEQSQLKIIPLSKNEISITELDPR
jgi:hypothetical protein